MVTAVAGVADSALVQSLELPLARDMAPLKKDDEYVIIIPIIIKFAGHSIEMLTHWTLKIILQAGSSNCGSAD